MLRGDLRKPDPLFILLSLTVLLAMAGWFLTRHFYEDDAFISLRYASNLAHGRGLTWNPGERIEGYTNFLMIVLEAVFSLLGINLMTASRLISFAAFFSLLFALWRYVRRQHGLNHRLHAGFALALAGSAMPLLAWCWGGLETVLFACLITAAVCLTLEWLAGSASNKKSLLTGLLLALAALTRPEGAMVFGITFLFLALKRERWEKLAIMGAAFAAIFLPYMAWRVAYFGDLLPNTYYAKAWGIAPSILWTDGLLYLVRCLLLPPWLILFGFGLVAGAARMRAINAQVAYLTLLVAAFLFYIVSVGGDFMPYERFFAPVIPLLALLVYHCLPLLAHKEKRWRDVTAALFICLLMQPAAAGEGDGMARGAISGLAVAPYVNAHWPKGASVALNAIGALPYADPDHHYIDMLGLTDRHIARRIIHAGDIRTSGQNYPGHMKGDGAYVLSRRPDYIIFGVSWGDDRPEFLSDAEIAASRAFRAHYKEITVWIAPPPALLPQLQAMAKAGSPGLKLNAENQLRFIYFERVK